MAQEKVASATFLWIVPVLSGFALIDDNLLVPCLTGNGWTWVFTIPAVGYSCSYSFGLGLSGGYAGT